RFGADTMEEDIDRFFNAVIEELVIPVVEKSSSQDTDKGLPGRQFWDQVFGRIAEMVADLSAGDRQLILRALVSVETYHRFRQLLEDESHPA
ncbi:MAG TPA: hypothetical protein VGL91_10465, partial [Acidobacteriota bacterium]